MGSLGPFEIIIIAVVLLLFFGAKRLPELARGIGKSLKEFKKATRDVQDEIENAGSSSDNRIDYDSRDDYPEARQGSPKEDQERRSEQQDKEQK